jgi:hypothetical protein
MLNNLPDSPKALSTAQIQYNLRAPLVTAENTPPPQYAAENLPVTPQAEPFTERPSTWGSVACGSLGGLGGSGAGYAIFGFPWGLAGAALCLPAMICGFRLFKNFDASAEDKNKTPCIGFEAKQRRLG